MKRILALVGVTLLIGLANVYAPSETKRLIFLWDPNPETNVAGYNLAVGTSTRNYGLIFNAGNKTGLVVTVQGNTNPVPSEWQHLNQVFMPSNGFPSTSYFAANAFNTINLTSDWSNELVYTNRLVLRPGAPGNLRRTP